MRSITEFLRDGNKLNQSTEVRLFRFVICFCLFDYINFKRSLEIVFLVRQGFRACSQPGNAYLVVNKTTQTNFRPHSTLKITMNLLDFKL